MDNRIELTDSRLEFLEGQSGHGGQEQDNDQSACEIGHDIIWTSNSDSLDDCGQSYLQ